MTEGVAVYPFDAMPCEHDPVYPSELPTATEALRACTFVERATIDGCPMIGPAFTTPDDEDGTTSTTQIVRDFYTRLSTAGRVALVAHERAHQHVTQLQPDGSLLRGTEVDCEGCVDKVAGYMMRAWGCSVVACFAGMDEAGGEYRRDAGKYAVEGAKECEHVRRIA